MPLDARPVAWEPILQVADPFWPGLDGPSARLIRSPDEWDDLWRYLTRGVDPNPARPPIDFRVEVVALLSTERGHEIEVLGAWRAGNHLFVEAVEIVPGPGCPVAATGEAAVAAIRVERWHRVKGRFLARERVRDCPPRTGSR